MINNIIFRIYLPLPPSVNKLYINNKYFKGITGRTKSPDYITWERLAKQYILFQQINGTLPRFIDPIAEPVDILYKILKPRKNADVANYEKALSDFISQKKGIQFLSNDSQIIRNCQEAIPLTDATYFTCNGQSFPVGVEIIIAKKIDFIY